MAVIRNREEEEGVEYGIYPGGRGGGQELNLPQKPVPRQQYYYADCGRLWP